MTSTLVLPLAEPDRTGRDRLELLTALINGPSFDPMFREEVIRIPPDHRVYPWHCAVADCERPRWAKSDLCAIHKQRWKNAEATGIGRACVCPVRATVDVE